MRNSARHESTWGNLRRKSRYELKGWCYGQQPLQSTPTWVIIERATSRDHHVHQIHYTTLR